MKHLLPKGTLSRVMEPLEVSGGKFTVQTDDGREVEWITFAIEFAFPAPRGKDAQAKLDRLQKKIEDYVQKGNRTVK